MDQGNLNLPELIGSRICHDLISPIGAIHNGLELLDMSGGMSGPEMGLIAESVTNAEAKIRFFRLAYGAAGNQDVARSEIIAVLRDISQGSRLRMDWRPPADQPRALVRLALLALQCLETALAYGGEITINESDTRWSVTGRADRTSLDPVLWAGLTDPSESPQITPALVQFALLPLAAQELGRTLTVTTAPDVIDISF